MKMTTDVGQTDGLSERFRDPLDLGYGFDDVCEIEGGKAREVRVGMEWDGGSAWRGEGRYNPVGNREFASGDESSVKGRLSVSAGLILKYLSGVPT